MSELLQSVKSVFDDSDSIGVLAEYNKKYFNIPLYQRGYKWTKIQVKKLLDDINRFTPVKGSGKFYCVQNITIVPNEKGYLNVVDGQQRLVTMTLILSVLGERELVKNKVKFPENSIREQTNIFINDFITDTADELLDIFPNWEDLVEQRPEFDHQDIYYLYHAYSSIENWLENELTESIDDFKHKLLNEVKFIINYIEGDSEEKVFGNLNSKRIYLDGADLVRAILITRVTEEESKKESDIKNIVRVNERRVRIGWQLDEINYWWSDKGVQTYFSPWTKLPVKGDIHFDEDKYPINRFLNLFLESENKDELSLEIIESCESAVKLYKKLNKLHATLKDWYNDKEIYHYLGFLFAQRRKNIFSFSDIWEYWNKVSVSRKDFKVFLLNQIKIEVFGTEDSLDSIFKDSKNWYEGDNKTLVQILLLLDIIDANKEYKDKLKSHAFFKAGNDIEHIFPQNPQEVKYKADYVKFLLKYDENLKSETILLNFNDKKEDEEYIIELNDFIDSYTKGISIHSIGNLVLLYDSLNRSISNNPYSYKRKKVMQYFNDGNFIQPHTLKVFARYFQDESTTGLDLEHWTQRDIESNENMIKTTLLNYFKTHLPDGKE